MRRHTTPYLALCVATVVLGLATRWYPSAFPDIIARYGGDALWAAMIFWLVAILRPATSTVALATYALGVSWAVECSQLYHAPWIDAVRATRLGGLVLGYGFLWSDLVSYGAGVVVAAILDTMIVVRREPTSRGGSPSLR